MTDKKPLSGSERSKRSRAADRLGLVWMAGYVASEDAETVSRAMMDAHSKLEEEIGK